MVSPMQQGMDVGKQCVQSQMCGSMFYNIHSWPQANNNFALILISCFGHLTKKNCEWKCDISMKQKHQRWYLDI